ncbi:tRNA glutamyl-Q(34) synthetase GluQRS [Mumia zhuanghuii]|uniref:tRNA glutamyl-Q(34) synthetase GluQRS n=2 Tax=Mumia TaxID=1546255 RepID=A0ABW1QIP2_9ACTN|nr:MULTISPECIES: tRNA glutamyl-Q(34) synthetase GluQRS [Mumia]KAA1424701.1 tRNA glutamyl-Q(34) synthetase GluQRS [Mumia zhuanghuii]
MFGRYAPSPSGDLHVGNLRTALLAWMFARSSGRGFRMRVEDLDRVRPGAQEQQLADLAALGIDWDPPVVLQSERLAVYADAVSTLEARGLTYECFCTRREIAEAASAPHGVPGHYPGTCRRLTEEQRAERRAERPAALRLASGVDQFTVRDLLHGTYTGPVDDLVLVRNDGVPAYNLAVVVDDAEMDVDQVVRGDDLLASAPRQAYLATLLGAVPPHYAHVALAVNGLGKRLAKRDGAVTLADLALYGWTPADLVAAIADSLGMAARDAVGMLDEFDPAALPRTPWVFVPPTG